LDPGVVALGWVSFLSDVASDMIYPLLPDFLTRTLHAGPAALGLIEGVAEATASFTKLASGWWSDRVGKRKPIVVASGLSEREMDWLSQKASFMESTSGKKEENVAFRAKSDVKEVSWLLS
jgi:MFS family permease